MSQAPTGIDRGEFDAHFDALFAPHLEQLAAQEPSAQIGVTWTRPDKRRKVDPDTGEVWWEEFDGHFTRWIPASDRDAAWECIQWATAKHGKLLVTLAPRKASVVRQWRNGLKSRGVGDFVAGVLTVRVDFDTLDGDHSAENLPTREQLPGIYASCPLGYPSIRVATAGGEHADWVLDRIVTQTEGKRLGRKMADWLDNLAEDTGLHFDTGVTTTVGISSRFAGTIHGKSDDRRDWTLRVIETTGLNYAPEDFERLPERQMTAKEKARQEAAAAARARRAFSGHDESAPVWVQFAQEVPASLVLEEVFGMIPKGSKGEYTWPDSRTGSASAEVYTKPDDFYKIDRFVAYGATTAAVLGVEMNAGGNTAYSLLLDRFCKEDSRLATALAGKFLAEGADSAISWMQERYDQATGEIVEPGVTGVSVADRVALAKQQASGESVSSPLEGAPARTRSKHAVAIAKINANCSIQEIEEVALKRRLEPSDTRTAWEILVEAVGDEANVAWISRNACTPRMWTKFLETMHHYSAKRAQRKAEALIA